MKFLAVDASGSELVMVITFHPLILTEQKKYNAPINTCTVHFSNLKLHLGTQLYLHRIIQLLFYVDRLSDLYTPEIQFNLCSVISNKASCHAFDSLRC